MGTVLAAPSKHLPLVAGKYDRWFYGATGAVLALIVLSAFGRTYYLTFFSGGPKATVTGGPFTALVHLHAALFSAWALLFIVQTSLISSRRLAVHRRVGVVGALLATAMVVSAARLAIVAAARGVPEGAVALTLLISFWDLALFATFVAAALLMRRDRESHKRLMLLAYIAVAKFAVTGRLVDISGGLPVFFGATLLLIAIPATYDLLSRRRIHNVYWLGGALILLSMPVRFAISGTSAWLAITESLTQ